MGWAKGWHEEESEEGGAGEMTIEEIERNLQTITEQNAGLTARQQRLEETVQDVAALQQQVLRSHEARQGKLEEAFQTLVELASATDSRLDSLEEGQVHTDARLDVLINSQIQLTQRFDQMTARVDQVTAHFDQMTARVDQVTAHFDQMTTRFDQMSVRVGRIGEQIDERGKQLDGIDERLGKVAELQAENAAQIKTLIAAQSKTEKRINDLLDRNGQKPARDKVSAKPKTGSKKARKAAKKGTRAK